MYIVIFPVHMSLVDSSHNAISKICTNNASCEQGVSNIFWAFANLNTIPTKPLLEKFIDAILGGMSFSPQVSDQMLRMCLQRLCHRFKEKNTSNDKLANTGCCKHSLVPVCDIIQDERFRPIQRRGERGEGGRETRKLKTFNSV